MAIAIVFALVCASLFGFTAAPTTTSSWNEGTVIEVLGSPVTVEAVTVHVRSEFSFARHTPGRYYYADCLSFRNNADVPATHVQFVFALVNNKDVAAHALPLDVKGRYARDMTIDGSELCIDYGFANGMKGLALTAWATRVDFADGTSWHAPPQGQMTPYILDALPRAPTL